jgi:hypothetical protein
MEFLPQPNQPEHESPESNRRANEQPHRRGLELSIDPIACDASNQNRTDRFENTLIGAASSGSRGALEASTPW